MFYHFFPLFCYKHLSGYEVISVGLNIKLNIEIEVKLIFPGLSSLSVSL